MASGPQPRDPLCYQRPRLCLTQPLARLAVAERDLAGQPAVVVERATEQRVPVLADLGVGDLHGAASAFASTRTTILLRPLTTGSWPHSPHSICLPSSSVACSNGAKTWASAPIDSDTTRSIRSTSTMRLA